MFLDSSKTCRKITWSITAYLDPLTLMTFWMDTFTGPISVDYLLDLSLRQRKKKVHIVCLIHPQLLLHTLLSVFRLPLLRLPLFIFFMSYYFFLCWVFLCLLKELRVGHEPLQLCFCKALWDIDSIHYLTEACWKQTGKVHLHHLLRVCCACYSVKVLWASQLDRYGLTPGIDENNIHPQKFKNA